MSFRNDFHGGRTYGADPADGADPGFGFNLGLVIAWAKLQLSRVLKSATAKSDIEPISTGEGNSPFSVLGATAPAPAPAAAAKPERRGK